MIEKKKNLNTLTGGIKKIQDKKSSPNSLSIKIQKQEKIITKKATFKEFPESKIGQRFNNNQEIVANKSFFAKINDFVLKMSRVPLKEKLFFVQNLALMLRVGISLSRALKTLANQTQNKYFVLILNEIAHKVENGASFSESLRPYRKVFGDLFINMIEAGELSGKLEEVLKELFIQIKKESGIIGKVRGAMTYPIVILVAMLGIGTFMIIFVVPKITANFAEMKLELPLPTKILIAASNAIINHGVLVIVSIVVLIILFIQIMRTQKGKSIFDMALLRLPVIGTIVKKINLARFSRNISSLLKTDIMIVKSFEITASVLGNVHYKKAILEMGAKLKKGESLTEAVKKYPKLFPPVVSQMICVGEETGDLDNILVELAEFYENDVDQIMTDLPALIEPILILILGVGVGGVAISIIMPMYSMTSAF